MPPFDIENSVGFLLAKVHQRLFAQFRQELAPFGITPPQFALLAFLWKEDGLSQTQLSEKSEVDRTTISGLVDRLARLDLVRRIPDPADRRAYLIELTATGRDLEKDLTDVALRVRRQFSSGLNPGEYDTLCALLKTLRE